MRMSVPQRHKGVGTKVVNKILRSDKTYMLEPVEDGKTFWKKFGFKEMVSCRFAKKLSKNCLKYFRLHCYTKS